MLLGAARHLCGTRAFAGTAAVVFQPAEEGGAGARAMLEDGLVSRFSIDRFFGMHNLPGLPVGRFSLRPGPIMASSDVFDITVTGKGSHAAMPHLGVDPVARPGAFIFIGNGDSAGLHNASYDFADAALPFGISYWVRLVEMAQPG